MKIGDKHNLPYGCYWKVTEVFALGYNYCVYNAKGDCVQGEKYERKNDEVAEEIIIKH